MDCRVKPGNDAEFYLTDIDTLAVMPGLDPGIHPLRNTMYRRLRDGRT
jgi:hypothetical protein